MKRTVKKISGEDGLTMMEVIAVLVIIGIIAIIAASRINDPKSFDLISQVEAVKAHLRLAQSKAMNASSPYGINFASSTTYYLFQGSNTTTPVRFVGEDNDTVNLVTKKSALTITSAPQVITFDAYGSPGTANITVVTTGGNITITENTGFIP